MFPLVQEMAATGAPLRVPVVVACRVLGFSKQAYYQWVKQPLSKREVEVDPVTAWACQVNKDEPACVLPEIPRLPVLVSFFVPLILLMWSYPGRPLVAAHGRGPPFLVH